MTSRARLRATTASGSQHLFAADVQYYLTQDPRQLPSRYLYDALGSALFEAICRLPWYSLTRAEGRLLESHAREILDDRVSTLIELGPGSGDKLSALIAAADCRRRPLDVHLVDVSPSALDQAERALDAFENIRVIAHEATYEAGLEEFGAARHGTGRSLALFLGSNIGNFDPPGREAFLQAIRRALRPGDTFLLGADLIKPERDLLLAYDDPLGVTAAFNRNLLVRINHELGGNFDLDGFAHRTVWNDAHSRVEMHLVSRRTQHVNIPEADLDFVIAEDESIWTESSYKYAPAEIVALLKRSGFRLVAQWVDSIDRFALTKAEAL